MNPERWRRIDELFRTVADRPPAEREAHLTRICGDDEELRREVLELLAHDPPDTFLVDPIKRATVAVAGDPEDELIGRHIGPYRLKQAIGRGGMGTVYEAVRDDSQFQQQVAVKLIKRGMDSAFIRERFLRERQILASLDHPHIARLFDGGTTSEGLPYFVMELVEGESITDYCRQKQLSLTDKLKLFRAVCAGVQHAHQKLVVHRDLKPSNILITADGTPKLLDFGIAKLLSPDPGEAFTRTETAVRLMTPDYASPEQVRGATVTTTTDVYSLGVVLYELLVERRPYQFETYTPLEIERAICDTEAPRPSDAAKQITASPVKLARQLSGDLDNIVLMALRKEPERRYQSVEQFSEDLQRYLSGLPVTARPDTFTYRTGKFVRRHRLAVVAALVVLFSLLGGIFMTTRAARQARAERTRAERRFAQVRQLANTFLFDFHDKIEKIPGSTEARALVAKTALEYLDSLSLEAKGDPQLESELATAYLKVGDVQGDPWAPNLGQSHDALQSYQKALALAQRLHENGDHSPKMLRLLAQVTFKVGALQAQSGGKTAAHDALSRALAITQTLEQQTHDLEDIRLLQNCLVRLGDTYLDTGDPVSALESYQRELKLSERRTIDFPDDRSQLSLAMSYSRVPEALISLGKITEAFDYYHQGLTRQDELLARHPADPVYLRSRMITRVWLGNISGNPRFINLGDPRAALRHYRESFALAEKIVALDPKNARAKQDLVGGHRLVAEILLLDQPQEAVVYCRAGLTLLRELLPADPEDPQLLRRQAHLLLVLANTLQRLGDKTGARQNLEQARQIWQTLLTRDATNQKSRADLHTVTLTLADRVLESGDRNGALALYREALSLAETPSVTQSADLYVRRRLADSYAGLNRYYTALATTAPPAERSAHWREARQYAQQSLSLWEGWSQHAPSTSFDQRQREQAAHIVANCDAALAKLNAATTHR